MRISRRWIAAGIGAVFGHGACGDALAQSYPARAITSVIPFAPAGTSRPIIDKLNKALREALASDEVKKQLVNDGTEVTPGTPEDYAGFIDEVEKKWSQLLKVSGVERE
jgi:tripartite-type tricarboxylate transporter receptor subunit TctC